jgi:hypothetical protein
MFIFVPSPFLKGVSNSVPTRLIRAELPRLRIFWRRLWLEKLGKLRSRAMLAIASFIIRYLSWQAHDRPVLVQVKRPL